MIRNKDRKYGILSKSFHWIIAAIILYLLWLGWHMTGLSYYDPTYHSSTELHKALGVTVFILLILKTLWMIISPMPKFESDAPKWEQLAAFGVHKILLLLMIFLPLSGYVISISAGAGVNFFDLLEVPAIIKVTDNMRDNAVLLHNILAYGGMAIIALHILAALKHKFIDKDDVLNRML